MKRTRILLGVAAVVTTGVAGCLAAVAIAPASSATASASSHHFTLRGAAPGTFGNISQKQGKESAGDSFTIGATLYRARRRVGSYDAVCVTTVPDARVECEATLNLADGQLETQASESETTKSNVEAIIGGTGHYLGAIGFITVTDLPDGNVFDVRLTR